MKALYHIIFIATLVYQNNGQDQNETIGEHCAKITNTTESDIEKFAAYVLPETKEGKCYVACVMELAGFMDINRKLTKEKAVQFIKNGLGHIDEMNVPEEEIDKCRLEANLKEDCETAYSFLHCLLEKFDSDTVTVDVRNHEPLQLSAQHSPVARLVYQLSQL